jgi:predicted NBD/HSP70 family sugar kinase
MTNLTIGMDLGDRYTQLCVLDGEGTEIETTRIRTTPAAVAQ